MTVSTRPSSPGKSGSSALIRDTSLATWASVPLDGIDRGSASGRTNNRNTHIFVHMPVRPEHKRSTEAQGAG